MSTSPTLRPGEIRAVGEDSLLVGAGDHRRAAALARAIRQSGLACADIVPGRCTVLVTAGPDVDPAVLSGLLGEGEAERYGPAAAAKTVTVPVLFDGEDLEVVGDLSGLGADGVVATLEGCELEVAFLGFAPGFAYLGGLPPALAGVPRRRTPRPQVPAGSVAVAGGFAAVYPGASPGGWHLLGRTDLRLWETERPPHALLAPGDRVRFKAALPGRSRQPAPPLPPEPGGGEGDPTLVVEEPGLFTTMQDGGRRGWAHLGVPGAGPADPVAHALANRLVGNPASAAALEITARGPVLRAFRPTHVAVVGGTARLLLDGFEAPPGRVVPLAAGQRLAVVDTGQALRAYLAVAGGFTPPAVLGSRATDSLSGLGPPPLVEGVRLEVGRMTGRLGGHLVPAEAPGAHGAATEWRVLPGPHPEWFTPGEWESLAERTFVVRPESDRVGVRLEPRPGMPVARRAGELDSQGMVTGAVQVPPDGSPVVLLPDHATHGGYPVLAVVVAADLGLLGASRPGDVVRLVPVDRPTADAARRELERRLTAAVRGHYPAGQSDRVTGAG